MGENDEWSQPCGLLLNGLLPNESTSVIRVLDREQWAKAEKRTAELIACIQPNQPSEDRRGAVSDYVKRLISKCFPCEVFTFGSVPLKTYLPDGDIDLTAFSKNLALKDIWGVQVRDILVSEEKNEDAEFRVKEVQYIQAEVKIVKCLVENIVVDISFNQLGGLCTLCFLEEVDNLINQNHLFKRSIILIKAWCYYESRILGAHHGLISTYALETLVLYIFHIFNNSFTGPLEVLYRFLEFFSNYDWDNFCVSLWGPVPVGALPDINAEPPRKDGGEMLLSKLFLQACNSVYAVVPGIQENQGQPFVSKHFNVIDPLRVNNNLGRSVSKGNFYRIRSAFAFGAKRLARIEDCSEENITFELNQFFMNTWERHGNGIRLDAPMSELQHSRPLNPDDGPDNHLTPSSTKVTNEDAPTHAVEAKARPLSSQRDSYPLKNTSKCDDAYTVSSGQNQMANMKSKRKQNLPEMDNSNLKMLSLKPDQVGSQLQGRHLFARTRSSPELTDAYRDVSSRPRHIIPAESGNDQVASTKIDSSQRKSLIFDTLLNQRIPSSLVDPSSGMHNLSHHLLDAAADLSSISNGFVEDSVTASASEDHASVVGAQGMHQEEQDLVNMMASSSIRSFSGHIPMPLNLASPHLPPPVSQSVLTSLGYGRRNVAGMVPAKFPLIDSQWASNLQFHQGLMPFPVTQYFPGMGLPVNSEELVERGSDSLNSVEMHLSADTEYWHEQDIASNGGYSLDDRGLDILHPEDRQPSLSASSSFAQSSHVTSFNSLLKAQQKLNKEPRMAMGDNCVDSFQNQDNGFVETLSDDRMSSARISSASQADSVRSKTSSESSWDGSAARVSKVAREKRGRKTVGSVAVPSIVKEKGKSIHDCVSPEADDGSRDGNTQPTIGNEVQERRVASSSASTLHVDTHRMRGFEGAQTSGSDSVVPISTIPLGPGSHQKVVENSAAVPFAFYPTGPPVPFFTMLPVYNYRTEGDSSEPSSSPLVVEEGPANSDSSLNFDSPEVQDVPDVLNALIRMRRATIAEPSEDPRPDILHSDFANHWQNLQYGRICQVPRYPASVVGQSPVVPPMYPQGHFHFDGSGRPILADTNLLTQLMSYGHRIVPVGPSHSGQDIPATVYQRYSDKVPRHRSGTGSYLPNSKASVRERHSSAKRNSYKYDRSDQADREGNWNAAKSRAAGRSHHNQAEKSRIDRFAASENRADQPWVAYRNEQLASYYAQNGQARTNSQGNSANMAYRMYQLPGMNPGGVTSNGPSIPPVVMLYPYDNISGYVSPGDQLEFGTLGPVGFVGSNDVSHSADAAQLRVAYENQRFHRSSAQHSSLDQQSSPHFQRRI